MRNFALAPFHPGDYVTRHSNVYDLESPLMHGIVMERYETTQYDPDNFLYPEPELYRVLWFNYYNVLGDLCGAVVSRGYFRHGLSPLH